MKLQRYLSLAVLAVLLGLGSSIVSLSESAFPVSGQKCTLTVQLGESIQKAIDQVREGGVICIAAGTWKENLVIEKSLTLRGVSREESIIKGKEVAEPVILIKSDEEIEVLIEGLTIAGAKGFGADGIRIAGRAKVSILNSQLSWNRGGGISMWDSSQATISGSKISGNDSSGIVMWSSSRATILGSLISGNGDDGIEMWGLSQAEIRGSSFLDNKGCGIGVFSEQATVLGGPNKMKGNGADLGGYAPAYLRQPLVSQTERTQLSVPGDYPTLQEAIDAIASGGTITVAPGTYRAGLTIWKPVTLRGAGEDETVVEPLEPTRSLIVSIISEAEGVHLEGLAITGSEGDGLLIYGKAFLKALKISGNRLGIGMGGSSQATISGSKISGSDLSGIVMWDSSRATILGSLISGNGDDGIEMWGLSRAEIRGNSFIDNKRCGIGVFSEQATVLGGPNKMKGNGADLGGYTPAYLRQPLVPQTERPQLSVPEDYPTLQEAIDAIAPGGTITVAPGTYKAGLTIWKPVTLRGAREDETVVEPLEPTRSLIISIISEAEGVHLEGLAITGSEGDGLLIYGKAFLKALKISGNHNGIVMRGSSQAMISGSKIFGNRWNGIEMEGLSQATISGSKISGNGRDGILMEDSSQATISSSKIAGNREDGIRMWYSSQATISGSKIFGNGKDGVLMWDSSQATISGSQISGNGVGGIVMGGSSQATISGSKISGNLLGIAMWDSSQATSRDNEIFKNKGYGIVLFQKPCFDINWKFKGKVEGSGNKIYDNRKGNVCPAELGFLMTEEGGCYGPLCD